MNNTVAPEWYLIGYLRTVPDERAFVFPVVQNADVAKGRAYYALNGNRLNFVEPNSEDSLIRITPLAIPSQFRLEDVLPIFAYEYASGLVWFGDAQNISKVLIDFSCGEADLSTSTRRDIASFVKRVVEKEEFVAKGGFLLQGQATILEGGSTSDAEEFSTGTKIKVIGVGGAGGRAVEHMIASGVQGVEFVCADTDPEAFSRLKGCEFVHLASGGTGFDSGMDRTAGLQDEALIRKCIAGTDLLFIAAGLGGDTGADVAPVIARVASDLGILTVAVVNKPFQFEGVQRNRAAESVLVELARRVDSFIVVSSDELLDVSNEDISQQMAFTKANEVLTSAVSGISDILNIPGLVNVDFEDIKTVLLEPGRAVVGVGRASGHDRGAMAAERAVAHPVVRNTDFHSAHGILVLITASRGTFKLSESRNAMNVIKRYASDDAHVIFGTAYDERLGDDLNVTVIATGLIDSTTFGSHPHVWRRRAGGVAAVSPGAQEDQPASTPVLMAAASVPSVWRRSGAAKAALSSSNEMDEIEIPAFLRSQAN